MEATELRSNLIVYHRRLDCCGLVHSWDGDEPVHLNVQPLNQHGHPVDPCLQSWRLIDLDVLTPA